MAQFEIRDLSFSYPAAKGKKSLDAVNLSIERGEYIVLCGRSGSGKTTLLRQLKTVLAPHGKKSGQVLFCMYAEMKTESVFLVLSVFILSF